MITRTITICTFAVLSVLLIFLYTSASRNAEIAKRDQAAMVKNAANEQVTTGENAGDGAGAAVAQPTAAKPRARQQYRQLPVMNIPAGFFILAVTAMSFTLIYIVGVITNDISHEDQEMVEDIFGTLN